jgi:hypothetical protein
MGNSMGVNGLTSNAFRVVDNGGGGDDIDLGGGNPTPLGSPEDVLKLLVEYNNAIANK